jgi:hypothetical protein
VFVSCDGNKNKPIAVPTILISLKRNSEKGKVSHVHVMKAYRKVRVQRYLFLTQMDAGGKLHTPTVLPSGKAPAVHTEKKPG